MTEPKPSGSPIDAERLATFLDGQLSEGQRAELLRELASSQDAHDDVVEAALLLRDLDDEPAADRSVVRPASKSSHHVPVKPWLVAATLAAIGLMSVLTVRSREPSVSRYASRLPSDIAYVTTFDHEPWSAVRGAAAVMSEQGRAVRIGARLTDLALALRGAHADVSGIAEDVALLLEPRAGGGPAAQLFRSVAAEPSGDRLERASGVISRAADRELIALGAWAQAARSAIDADQAEAIDRGTGIDVIDDALPAMRERPAAAQAAHAVRALLESNADTRSLEPALTRLLTEAAR